MRIAITGINATDNPGPGVGVARCIRETFPQAKIFGLSYDLNDPGNYMDFLFNETFILPYPSNGFERILSKIKLIKTQYGLDFIIPCLDAELPLFIKHKNALEELGIKTLLPSEEQFNLRDKQLLTELSKNIGLFHPQTIVVEDLNQLLTLANENLKFPMLVKGRYYKAYIVKNVQELLGRAYEISNEWGLPLLLQEMVSGEEFNLIGVGDGKGGHLGIVAIKKISTTHLGKIWMGVTIENEKIIESANKFIKHTKWRGPFEIECIFNNEQNFLIEINPRFPSWVYFSKSVGINLPVNLINILKNENFRPLSNEYERGKLFVRYSYELVTDVSKMGMLIAGANLKNQG